MNQPQDGRAGVPSDWQAPRGRAHAREQSAETDDPHLPRRPARHYAAGEEERRPKLDRPGSTGAVPTAGFYAAATRQRADPSAGRYSGLVADDRPRGNPTGPWADPYAEGRPGGAPPTDRGWNGQAADDDWDTQVFSLLPNRAPAEGRGRSTRASVPEATKESEDPRDTARARTDAKLARQVAAIASLAAGVVHVFATPTHWGEWPLAGAFFAATAGFQLIWGLLAFPIGHAFLRVAGIVANIGFLGLWAVSRVWGVPFGPHAGVPESFAAADLIAAAMEAAIVVGLIWSLLPRERHGILSTGGYRAVLVFAVVALGAMAVPGSAAALQHSHSHESETGDHEDGHEDGHDHEHGTEETTDMESPAESEASADPEAEESEPAEDHTHAPGEEHD